jgi:hypothetical protein
MTVHVHIARLVLHGAPLGRAGEATLRRAMTAELGRLLAGAAPPPGPAAAGAAEATGRQVAQAVHARLGGPAR